MAKAVHFGLNNPDAAVRIHWKLYPQSKRRAAKRPSCWPIRAGSRFADYELHDTSKYGETLAKQWDDLAAQMKEQGLLPADFDVRQAYKNEFVDQINDWDRGRVEAQAKAWVPA